LRIHDLPEDVVTRVVERLRAHEANAIGVLVHGSYALGRARPESDLDLAVLLDGPGRHHYQSWFEELADGSLLYVSANTDLTVERWRAKQEEPEEWSFGFPAAIHFEWLWTASEGARSLLGDPPVERHPASHPEIEDIVETATKVIRAAAAGDEDGVRFWAHSMIRYTAPAFVAVNEPREVRDPREALECLLGLARVPPGWRHDVRACLGLVPHESVVVAETARRLTMNVLAFLREGFPGVDAQPGVSEALAAGTYERWLAGM
jgi:predicted nucleotidyltransferase